MDVLGGERTLKRRIDSPKNWIEVIRAGLPYPSLESVMHTLALSREEASSLLSVPLRTLVRRKKEHRLRADESDRLFRVANVAAHAIDVFGSREKAARWLRRPNRALGGAVPLTLLDTAAGATQVDQILGRIEHGVYS